MTYTSVLKNYILKQDYQTPIYTKDLGKVLANKCGLSDKKATMAATVAINRILKKNEISDLKRAQKGVYYLAKQTVFGPAILNDPKKDISKYMSGNVLGYDTGANLLYELGMTTQIPAYREIVTNAIKQNRTDKKQGVIFRVPKEPLTEENIPYLKYLDMVTAMNRCPINEHADTIARQLLVNKNLDLKKLLLYAKNIYGMKVVEAVLNIVEEKP